jgi:hypothetical protein
MKPKRRRGRTSGSLPAHRSASISWCPRHERADLASSAATTAAATATKSTARRPGVTSVLNTLPKDALINWAARVTAEAAVDRWDELGAPATVAAAQGAATTPGGTSTRKPHTRGTKIHDLGEKLSHGEKVDVPDAHVGPVEAYARFLDKWDIDHLDRGAVREHRPRLRRHPRLDRDSIGKLGIGRCMLDLKTGKGVYESTALQLVGLRRVRHLAARRP